MTSQKHRRSHRSGLVAEWLALVYLLLKGYFPLAMRYKTPVGEIDLIMKRGRRLVFVEVKARADVEDAAHAVHAKNQARVVRAAQHYLHSHPQRAGHEVRFDVCLIAWYRWPKHLLNAFS
jgi:putative endonuclease